MNRLYLLIIFFAFQSIVLSAQDLKEKAPLRQVLVEIEQRHSVTFTYADESVDGIDIAPPLEKQTIEEVIVYLESVTGLKFQQINDDIYSIIKPAIGSVDICGIILEYESETFIEGATIQFDKSATVTDKEGNFFIERIAENDTITIRFLGFESLSLAAKDFKENPCKTVFLKQTTTKLEEIIITDFITEGIDINSEGSIKINALELGILPGLTDPDVLKTIQALPGIQSINETVSDINVRGGTNDQNLIFWDGIKMYQSGHFFGLISAFNPYLTKDVILIKNGTTAALSDGVSSTIDIRTDDEVSQAFSGGAGINMLNADLFLKIPIARNVSIQLSGRRSISDIIQTPTYQQYFDRVFRNTDVTNSSNPELDSLVGSDEHFNFYDVSAKLLYDISRKDKLRINFLQVFNTINYEEVAQVNRELESRTSGLNQESLGSSFFYNRAWNSKLSTMLQLYYSDYELEATNFDLLNDQRLIQENRVVDTGIKLHSRIALNNTIDFYTGYQFFEVGVSNLADINNPVYRRLIKKVLRSHALFIEGNYSSSSGNSNIRIGLRGNYFEKYNRMIFEPRLALSQRIAKDFSIEVLGEMKSQATTQIIDLQNDFLGVEKRRWILANGDDIPIVESKQLSLGIRYQPGKLIIGLEGYYKEVDGITSSSQGFQNQFQYIRTNGSYNIKGIDFLINQRLGSFNTWLSYSYTDNTYNFPEFTPSIFPNNLDIRHTATFGLAYQTKNFQFSAGVNWRTGKPVTLPEEIIEDEIIYEDPNTSRLKDYLRIDLSAKYSFQISRTMKGELGASIWNLSDNQNIVNTYYQVDKDENLKTIQQYALGFTPNIMFRVSF